MVKLTNKDLPKNDVSGQRFGRLLVVSFAERRNGIVYYNCKCDCGKMPIVNYQRMRNGKTKSCGCFSRDINAPENLARQKFGRLTVDKAKLKENNKRQEWICKCDCGGIKIVSSSKLKSGVTRSCGCLIKNKGIRTDKDLVGKRFGRLIVTSFSHSNGDSYWNVKCDCGSDKIVKKGHLKKGETVSCGCFIKEKSTKHGMRHTLIYHVWLSMKDRVFNKKCKSYDNYGGRGIDMSKDWADDFMNFYNDMGDRPSKKHSIERVDNNKGYYKDNCVWALPRKQGENKRTNRNITHNEETLCVTRWEEKLGFKKGIISSRLWNGWSETQALTTPVGIRRKDYNGI